MRQKVAGNQNGGRLREGVPHIPERRAQQSPIGVAAIAAETGILAGFEDRHPVFGPGRCEAIDELRVRHRIEMHIRHYQGLPRYRWRWLRGSPRAACSEPQRQRSDKPAADGVAPQTKASGSQEGVSRGNAAAAEYQEGAGARNALNCDAASVAVTPGLLPDQFDEFRPLLGRQCREERQGGRRQFAHKAAPRISGFVKKPDDLRLIWLPVWRPPPKLFRPADRPSYASAACACAPFQNTGRKPLSVAGPATARRRYAAAAPRG